MAIQMRRGPWSQFDPTKMLPGEWAVILSGHPDTSNGQALYHCFTAGSVKQIATIEDAATIIANATEDIRDELTQDIASALAQVGAATNAANTATANANTATSAANAATQAATSASERAEDAIDAMGDISELAVPLMSADIRGGAKLEEHGGLVLRDEKLGIGSLVQESDGTVRGGIAELTAKGHAKQASTTGKNLLPNNATSQTINGVTFTVNADKSITVNGTATSTARLYLLTGGTVEQFADGMYTLSGCPANGTPNTYMITLTTNENGSIKYYAEIGSGISFIKSSTKFPAAIYIEIKTNTTVSNLTFYPQLELGSTATAYEPYTGAAPSPSPEFPQTIEVVSGRNLLDPSTFIVVSGGPDAIDSYGYFSNSTPDGDNRLWNYANRNFTVTLDAGTYTISFDARKASTVSWDGYRVCTSDGTMLVSKDANPPTFEPATFTLSQRTTIGIMAKIHDGIYACMLTLGSTPQPYVPYGYVGMEVRDPDTDELISCTPIPLPSRGWVGSLPDGTADVLTLDGAGKVTWLEETWEHTFDGSDSSKWVLDGSGKFFEYYTLDKAGVRAVSAYKSDVILATHFKSTSRGATYSGALGISFGDAAVRVRIAFGSGNMPTLADFQSWLSTHPVTILYPLATPVTESLGYIDLPSIDGDCTISIPELDELGVRYFVDDSAGTLARQWAARLESQLGDAIVELAARVAALES